MRWNGAQDQRLCSVQRRQNGPPSVRGSPHRINELLILNFVTRGYYKTHMVAGSFPAFSLPENNFVASSVDQPCHDDCIHRYTPDNFFFVSWPSYSCSIHYMPMNTATLSNCLRIPLQQFLATLQSTANALTVSSRSMSCHLVGRSARQRTIAARTTWKSGWPQFKPTARRRRLIFQTRYVKQKKKRAS